MSFTTKLTAHLLQTNHKSVKEAAGADWERLVAEIGPRLREYQEAHPATCNNPLAAAGEIVAAMNPDQNTARAILAVAMELSTSPDDMNKAIMRALKEGAAMSHDLELADNLLKSIPPDLQVLGREAFKATMLNNGYAGGNIMQWLHDHAQHFQHNGRLYKLAFVYAVELENERIKSTTPTP